MNVNPLCRFRIAPEVLRFYLVRNWLIKGSGWVLIGGLVVLWDFLYFWSWFFEVNFKSRIVLTGFGEECL
jgi:hypothetical protein